MRMQLIVILAFGISGCSIVNKSDIESKQIASILEQTLFITRTDMSNICLYDTYVNQDNKDSLIAFYRYMSTAYEYEVQDSIVKLLSNRPNRRIPPQISSFSKYEIKYSNELNAKDIILTCISEPILISDTIYMLIINNKHNDFSQKWMFFLEKNNDSFKLLSLFDYQEKRFFKAAPLK